MAIHSVQQSNCVRDLVCELHAAAEQVKHIAFALRDGPIAQTEEWLKEHGGVAGSCGTAQLMTAQVLLGLVADLAEGMHAHVEALELSAKKGVPGAETALGSSH